MKSFEEINKIGHSLGIELKRIMKKLILILLFTPVLSQAQQVSVSPVSIKAWGSAPATGKIAVSYMDFEAVYLHAFQTMYDGIVDCSMQNGCSNGVYNGGYFALFWTPLDYELGRFGVDAGAGYFFRKYPTRNGRNLNFTVKLTYMFTDMVGVRYSHISSGFQIFSDLNPGVDSISLVINFN